MLKEIPRCFDHHNHFSLYLALSACPSLNDVHEKAAALDLMAALPADRPNLVTGWHSDRFALDRQDLAGMPPVAVINFCLHGYLMNGAAADSASSAGFPLEPGSALEAERLMPQVLGFFGGFAGPGPDAGASLVKLFEDAGLYGVEDMLFVPGDDAFSSGRFRLDTWATPQTYLARGHAGIPGFSGLKLFADGAVGSRTAAIGRGFLGGGTPVLTQTDHDMAERIRWCFCNMPSTAGLAIHAIGDLAIQQVLDAVSAVAAAPGMPADLPSRVRIEHAQFITPGQALRARDMGVTLSMQPNFSSDSVAYRDRLPVEALAANNPFRMLIDDAGFIPGRDLIFGSDGMPHGIVAAMQDALFPPVESQYLSLDELLAGYDADSGFGKVLVEVDPQGRTVSAVPR